MVDKSGALIARAAALDAVKAAVAKITVMGVSVASHVTAAEYEDVANAASDAAVGAYDGYINAPKV